jgi:hypothetical protein
MFALVMIAFTLAAVFGVVVLAVACLLLASPRLRRLGVAVVLWGAAGSVASFALFILWVIWGEHGREPVFSQVGAMFAAAGFGIAGAAGGVAFLAIRGLRLPNRWADRRRPAPPPNYRLERL